VLVDEYQDTNPLQSRILRALCTNGRITVVGDDAQSIYAFRGATIRNILDFPQQFPDTTIVTLERNYRSTASILDTTNALIARSRERYSKQLWTDRTGGEAPWLVTLRDEHEQTTFVVDRILQLHDEGIPLREMAVLFRAGYLLLQRLDALAQVIDHAEQVLDALFHDQPFQALLFLLSLPSPTLDFHSGDTV
jgi:DNA helicase-2/ATP-dependent DNA helicase PcrA